MEPVVVVVLRHILRSLDHEMRIVTEPEAVQHQGVEPVHDIPEGIGREDAAPEGRAAVDVFHQQTQKDAEDEKGRDLLRIEDRSAGTVALIYEAELAAALDDGRGIVEDHLHRIPGHQVDQQGEESAGREGFEEEGHRPRISLMMLPRKLISDLI